MPQNNCLNSSIKIKFLSYSTEHWRGKTISRLLLRQCSIESIFPIKSSSYPIMIIMRRSSDCDCIFEQILTVSKDNILSIYT